MKYVLLFLLLVVPVGATPENVHVLDLDYNQGVVQITDVVTLVGYVPDRNIQPLQGHHLGIFDAEERELYGFQFEVPTREYIDGHDNGEHIGEVVDREQVRFALIIPALPEAKDVRIFDAQAKEQDRLVLVEEKRQWVWWLLGLALLAFIVAILPRLRS